jgi:phosphoglucomutase
VNGAPVGEATKNKTYETANRLASCEMAEISDVDLSLVGIKRYGQLEVEIIDTTVDS